MLRNERNARRINHPHATYSTSGALLCAVCDLQIKSESLWTGHLKSAQHIARAKVARDNSSERPLERPAAEVVEQEGRNNGAHGAIKDKKRKADEDEEPVRKKSRPGPSLEDFHNENNLTEPTTPPVPGKNTPPLPGGEIQLPSRPATPLKTPPIVVPPRPLAAVDEDEWAAFEADIAAVDAPAPEDAVISAPAMTTEELAAKDKAEDAARRREALEAELEGDKEDAVRKLEDEFEEMEALEERIKRLKEKREALRMKDMVGKASTGAGPAEQVLAEAPIANTAGSPGDEDDNDDDDEDDDDWDGFRLRA